MANLKSSIVAELASKLDQADDHFQFVSKGAPLRQLRITHFRGEEKVNDLYEFELDFFSHIEGDPLAALEGDLLGHPASLLMNEDGAPSRVVHGIVTACGTFDDAVEQAGARVRVTIAPRLSLLQLRTNNRIYQDKTIPEI